MTTGADRWRPGAAVETLRARAELLAQLRAFFAERDCLEVDVPLLSSAFGSDLCIEPIVASVNGAAGYLQSSPEFFLKRLLAAGSGDVYTLGKAFRNHERGARHNPEFTLLEWYRCGWDERRLIAELETLLLTVLGPLPSRQLSYAELFTEAVGLCPHTASVEQLHRRAAQRGSWVAATRAAALDLLFSELVEPALPAGLVFVCDYPACHGALAVIEPVPAGYSVARRFELFCDGVELANGYRELTDGAVQRRRFEVELAERRSAGQQLAPLDERLLAALESGLPACAGVALGVDRLLMRLLGEDKIDAVMPFSWPRCS